jgi:hypothetical protein
MRAAGGRIAVSDHAEPAVHGFDRAIGEAPHDRFVRAAVMDQVGDRADLQVVLRGELEQVGQPRHRAVVLHDLAQHCRRREAREPREIAAGLGMPGAHQHAARLGDQRKHMAGLHDVGGFAPLAAATLDRQRTVVRGDAGRNALGGLDRRR